MRIGNDTWVANLDNIDRVLERIVTGTEKDVAAATRDGVDKTADDMKALTKATAPVDDGHWEKLGFPKQRGHGKFRRSIKVKKQGEGFQRTDTWYVSGKEGNLTHLLEHGHEQFVFGVKSENSPRFAGHHFVKPARDKAEEEIAGNVEEAYERITGGRA